MKVAFRLSLLSVLIGTAIGCGGRSSETTDADAAGRRVARATVPQTQTKSLPNSAARQQQTKNLQETGTRDGTKKVASTTPGVPEENLSEWVAPPELKTAGAKDCRVGGVERLAGFPFGVGGYANAKVDVAYNAQNGLIVWPEGDHIRTQVLSAAGIRTGEPGTVAMPVSMRSDLFAMPDGFLLMTQSFCPDNIELYPMNMGASPKETHKRIPTGCYCTALRKLDSAGQPAGPVLNMPGCRENYLVKARMLTSRQMLLCAMSGKWGPVCYKLHFSPENNITPELAYNMSDDPARVGITGEFSIAGRNQKWVMWLEDHNGVHQLIIGDAHAVRHIDTWLQKNLTTDERISEMLLRDNHLEIIVETQRWQQPNMYMLRKLSLNGVPTDEGGWIGEDIPTTAPWDTRVQFYQKRNETPCQLRRRNIAGEPIGLPAVISEQFSCGHVIEQAWSGSVLTLLLSEHTQKKQWTIYTVTIDCAPD